MVSMGGSISAQETMALDEPWRGLSTLANSSNSCETISVELLTMLCVEQFRNLNHKRRKRVDNPVPDGQHVQYSGVL